MNFTFTEAAIEALSQRQATENLSLYYHVEPQDCGCPNGGIFILRVNDSEYQEYDIELDTNLGTIKAQKWAMVYLDQENKMDFRKNAGTFSLKSERGYLNMNVPLERKEPISS
ncbi:iron-sulfur cluster biosynthesis family protein [Jeotgalibaca caeni]|uniref:iron-sulfur cluster biosynthesis family protein n=1 Tax=Jeotgalibaca caeni TaxID=3028623 RepID=UPI00237E9755|nr:iron-sulfur cluster biosynthesis family protein [Jeotgalibaca caeni]MDE1549656.1 iron-sulfur cluster biosynthesis family protein [Jeotgalibaca caeni]